MHPRRRRSPSSASSTTPMSGGPVSTARSPTHRGEAEIEYLPIDNVDGAFATAGAALNHGASLARHDHLVFVHQDVYLHSLAALEVAAGALADDGRSALLARSASRRGRLVGRIRDRVILLGRAPSSADRGRQPRRGPVHGPARLLQREPLAEAPELAWHAYAVEYGLRARRWACASARVDIPLTHNSLTANLDRLDVAYAAVAASYPEDMPVRASCGMSTPRRAGARGTKILRAPLALPLAARVGRRATRQPAPVGRRCVLGDIRLDIDDLLAAARPRRCWWSTSMATGLRDERPSPLELPREGDRSRSRPPLTEAIVGRRPAGTVLVTNLIATICGRLPAAPPGRASRISARGRLLDAPRRVDGDRAAELAHREGQASRDAGTQLMRASRRRWAPCAS